MKLIVGLGNPGNEFRETRHNIGFDAIDFLMKKLDILKSGKKFDGEFYEFINDGEKVILLKPQKFMNLSGLVINSFINYYKIDIKDILVIHDDLDLEFGKLRLKVNSSSGGHNGIKNIEESLNTINYKRLKVGIGSNELVDTKKYVLEKFNSNEQMKKEEILNKIYLIIMDFFKIDFEALMNKYN